MPAKPIARAKTSFKPLPSSDSGGEIVELSAQRVRGQGDQNNECDIKVAAMREEGARQEERFSFQKDADEQDQVTVFEKQNFHGSANQTGRTGIDPSRSLIIA